MNEDETPLHQIIWQRFLKALGPSPAMDEAERNWCREAWSNRIAIVRGILIASAAAYLVNASWFTPSSILKAILGLLPSYSNFAAGYKVAGLLLLALMSPLIVSWGTRYWRYCLRHSCIPLFVIALLVAWGWIAHHPECLTFVQWLCAIFLFVSATALGWHSQEPDPVIVDHLQRGYFVERLFELFQVPNATMKRIAVLGTWGAGKTTVLHLLRQRLKQSESPKFGVALVNPWVAKSPEDMQRMLAEAFDEALGQPNYFASPWSRLPWLSWLTGFKAAAGFGLNFDLKQVFEGGSSLQDQKLIHRINRDLRALKKTCVILVDDMERADPEIIRKMFPVINVLRDIESCFFVFAIDPDRVAKAFNEDGHSSSETKGYLDKVFDLQLPLPEPRNRDMAVMCRQLLNRDETPKLAACFERLVKHLPTNPRDTIRFMNDAKAKEALFLTRYAEREKNFYSLFLLRLAELELPGITDSLKSEFAQIYRKQTRKTAFSHRDPHADDNVLLSNVWKPAGERRHLPAGDEKRLKAVLAELLVMEDMEWASYQHMRLLTPTSEERLRLMNYWIRHAGEMSLEQMIPSFLPGRKFSDIGNAAHELIEAAVEEYTETRDKMRTEAFEIDLALTRGATSMIDKLRFHFQATIANNWGFDLALFDAELFDIIGKAVCAPIPRHAELSDLVSAERAFHKELTRCLPFSEAYGRAMLSDQNLFEYWASPKEDMSFCESHLTGVREAMAELIADSVLKWTEGVAFFEQWRRAGMTKQRELEPLQMPHIWVPKDKAKRALVLERLTRAFQHYVFSSKLASRAIRETLHQLSAWLNGANLDDAKSHAEYFLKNQDFFAVVWQNSDRSDLETAQRLQGAKEALLNASSKNPGLITAEQIEAILPPESIN